jgi:hypothetical protein
MNQKLKLRLQQIHLIQIHLASQLLLEKKLQKHQEKLKQKRLLMKLRLFFKKRLKLKKRHQKQLTYENHDLLSRMSFFSSQVANENLVKFTLTHRMTI